MTFLGTSRRTHGNCLGHQAPNVVHLDNPWEFDHRHRSALPCRCDFAKLLWLQHLWFRIFVTFGLCLWIRAAQHSCTSSFRYKDWKIVFSSYSNKKNQTNRSPSMAPISLTGFVGVDKPHAVNGLAKGQAEREHENGSFFGPRRALTESHLYNDLLRYIISYKYTVYSIKMYN